MKQKSSGVRSGIRQCSAKGVKFSEHTLIASGIYIDFKKPNLISASRNGWFAWPFLFSNLIYEEIGIAPLKKGTSNKTVYNPHSFPHV